MSPVVTTEFVQLPADRTANVVDQKNGSFTVSLSGPTAANASNITASSTPTERASGHYVTAEFQQATTASPDPIDWTILGQATPLQPLAGSNLTNVTYQGTITFPGSTVAGAKHRILLREYEVFAADAQTGVSDGVGLVQADAGNTSYKLRLVYTDAVTIGL
jgi:hypothetical protein